MSIHTPGPWKVAQVISNSQLKPHDKRGYAGDIAYVYTDRPYPKGVCVASVREELFGEVKANAQLIAAAPTMKKELEIVREFLLTLYEAGNSEAGQYAASIDTTLCEANGAL